MLLIRGPSLDRHRTFTQLPDQATEPVLPLLAISPSLGPQLLVIEQPDGLSDQSFREDLFQSFQDDQGEDPLLNHGTRGLVVCW